MNKQEEIREGIKKFLQGTAHNGYYEGLEGDFIAELHSQGVVMKVRKTAHLNANTEVCDNLVIIDNGVEYVAVEPLID